MLLKIGNEKKVIILLLLINMGVCLSLDTDTDKENAAQTLKFSRGIDLGVSELQEHAQYHRSSMCLPLVPLL